MDENPPEDIDWKSAYVKNKELLHSNLYKNLENAVEACRNKMLKLQSRISVNEIAWYCRNLLELQVWIEFCCRDKQNAEEFYEDAVRDLVDLNRDQGPHDEQLTKELRKAQTLIRDGKKPHEYRTTVKAAVALGAKDETTSWEEYFKNQNKILSKFVHPTALSVALPLPRKEVSAIQKQFVEAGEEYAKQGLQTLHGSFLKALHDKYEPVVIQIEHGFRSQGKRPPGRAHFLQDG